MASKPISIYVGEDFLERLSERDDNRSMVIQRDLERLYQLYERALLKIDISVQEALLLTDPDNASLNTSSSVQLSQLMAASVEDTCELFWLDKKWDVDRKVLVDKLKALTDFEAMAIIDACERFWRMCSNDERSTSCTGEEREKRVKKLFRIR